MAKKPSEKSRELYQYLKIHFSEEYRLYGRVYASVY